MEDMRNAEQQSASLFPKHYTAAARCPLRYAILEHCFELGSSTSGAEAKIICSQSSEGQAH